MKISTAQEELCCERKPSNHHDKHVVTVVKDGETEGHIPRLFSKTCFFILLFDELKKAFTTGKREKKRKGARDPLRRAPCDY